SLIGREAEVAELIDAFNRARSGGTFEIALVVGDAGVGKSRLASEVVSQIGADAGVFVGRCLHYGEGITFWPIAEIIRAAASIDDRDTPQQALAKVEGLFGDDEEAGTLAQGVGVAVGLVEAELTIGEVFLSIRTLFEAIGRERPVVLVIDDLHWGEEALF